MREKDNLDNYQWYIATTYSGREDSVVNDLLAKIKSLDLDKDVSRICTFKTKKVTERIFDASNPPPAHMRNSKNIRWEAGNKPGTYKKIETKIINKFPGYIFIKMILNDKVWLAIRNSFYITGFVGSSGKGAKPIPVSEDELKAMSLDDPNFYDELNDVGNKSTESTPTNDLWKVGNSAKIIEGQWKDRVGTITNIDEKTGTITLDVDILGSVNKVNVVASELEKI